MSSCSKCGTPIKAGLIHLYCGGPIVADDLATKAMEGITLNFVKQIEENFKAAEIPEEPSMFRIPEESLAAFNQECGFDIRTLPNVVFDGSGYTFFNDAALAQIKNTAKEFLKPRVPKFLARRVGWHKGAGND